MLLIQHKTIHRSIPNLSDHIRWSLDLRYSDPAQPSGRDGVPGFIARSQAHPESVAQSVDDWLALFETASPESKRQVQAILDKVPERPVPEWDSKNE